MQAILSNVAPVAALAIIVAAVAGFLIAVIASVFGRSLDAQTFELVKTLVTVLVGLAIGSGAGMAVGTTRTLRAFEMQAQALTLSAKSKGGE